jgi:hypothetical protein
VVQVSSGSAGILISEEGLCSTVLGIRSFFDYRVAAGLSPLRLRPLVCTLHRPERQKNKYGARWNNTQMGIQTHGETPHDCHFDHRQSHIYCLAITLRLLLCEYGDNAPNVCSGF